jgi:two-component system, chemotaxis family, chemotaxis protein CheY
MSRTVLIIDDSASARTMLALTLKGAGYEVLEGTDGRHALTLLDGRKIHLIISDLNMPNLDGIGFLKALRQNAGYRFTPVIMLTTEGQEARKLEGKEAGARAWIVKPFSPPQLLDAVSKLVLR